MSSMSPLNSASNELQRSQIDFLRSSRAYDIERYLKSEFSGMKRNDFVSEMIRDHNLRIAVIQTREERQIISSSVSERSLTILEQLCDSIAHLNSFFPNSPGLAGYQGSGTCDGPRKHHRDWAVKFANDLFNEGQLEDVALENGWIAERNFEIATKLDRILPEFRKGSTRYNNVMKEQLVPYLPTDPSTGAIHPIRLTELFQAASQGSLFPEPALIGSERSRSEVDVELLFKPISAFHPDRHIGEKLVEAEKLIARVIRTADEQAQGLLRQVFHQYLPGEIHGPNGKYSTLYFKEVLNRIADAANTNDAVWNVMRPGLVLSIESGIYGLTGDLVPEIERRPVLLEAFKRLPKRLEDKEVCSVLREISLTKIPSVARDACSVFMLLPAEMAVSLLINVMTTHQGPELKPLSAQIIDPYDSVGFTNPEFVALQLLATCDVTRLRSAQIFLAEHQTPKSLTEYTNNYLKLRASEGAVSGEFVDIDSVLFPLLAKLDMKLLADRVTERLSSWRGSKVTFSLFVTMIDNYFGSRFTEEVIDVLATQHTNDRNFSVPYDLIELIRDKWKVPRDFVTRLGGEELSALIFR